jgi:hypothetical protein
MWRLYKTGIGLTTGFFGSHTVTHNYSVYTLQLAVHYSTCRVFLQLQLTLTTESLQGPEPPADPTGSHWPSTNSSGLFSATHRQLTRNWNCPTLGPNTNSSVFWRLALCNSLDRTAVYWLLQLAYIAWPAPCWVTWCSPRARIHHFVYVILVMSCLPRARVRHIVYVTSAILFTSHSTVDCCLQQARHTIFVLKATGMWLTVH